VSHFKFVHPTTSLAVIVSWLILPFAKEIDFELPVSIAVVFQQIPPIHLKPAVKHQEVLSCAVFGRLTYAPQIPHKESTVIIGFRHRSCLPLESSTGAHSRRSECPKPKPTRM